MFSSCKQPTGGGSGGGTGRSCTVTFNMMGHGTQLAKKTLAFGNMLKATDCQVDNVKNGENVVWEFDGWLTEPYTNFLAEYASASFDDSKYRFNHNSPVTRDLTLYAKWKVGAGGDSSKLVTVTVDASKHGTSDTGIQAYTIQMLDGENIVLSDYDIKIGGKDYVVDAWTASKDDVFDATTGKITKLDGVDSVTITATWIEAITITFVMNGHGVQVAPVKVKANCTIDEPSLQTQSTEDVEIEGWYTNEKLTGTKVNFNSQTFTESTTLYAKWKASYTITFNLQNKGAFPSVVSGVDLEEVSTYVKKVKVGSDKNVNNIFSNKPSDVTESDETYVFGGWCTDADGKNSFANTTTFTKSMTLYAKWNGMVTVTFELDKARSGITAPASQKIKWGGSLGSSFPLLNDDELYVFGYWANKRTGVKVTKSTTIKENMTLVSFYYSPITVTYDVNGKSIDAPPSIQVKRGGQVTLSTPQDPIGWKFLGWATQKEESTGTTYNANSVLKNLTEDMTLYARWEEKWWTVKIENIPFANGTKFYVRDGKTIDYVKHSDKEKYIWNLLGASGSMSLLKGLKEKSSDTTFINTQQYKVNKNTTLYAEYMRTGEIFRKSAQTTTAFFKTLKEKIDDVHKASNTTWNLYYATKDMSILRSQYTYKASMSSNSDHYSIYIYNKNGTNDYYYLVSREGNMDTGSMAGEPNLSYTLGRNVIISMNVNVNTRESNTSHKKNIYYVAVGIFENLERLAIIDLQGFDMRSLKTTNNMFKNCKSLKEVRCSKYNGNYLTDKWNVSNMTSMFQGCSQIEEIRFDLLNKGEWSEVYTNLIACSYMFDGCQSLKRILVPVSQSDWVTPTSRQSDPVPYYESDYMFRNCTSHPRFSNISNPKNFNIRCANAISDYGFFAVVGTE